jgi:carboxypeptidase C (cathepsin A)
MFGLFNENGPFYVATKNFPDLVANNYTWAKEFSVVYIDNPVGAVRSPQSADSPS